MTPDELAARAADLIREVLPGAVESEEGGDHGFGVGPGYKGLVFVLTPFKDRVRLGIAGGATLPDPDGLMQGSGRVHRHVVLRTREDLESPALRALLERAAAARSAGGAA